MRRFVREELLPLERMVIRREAERGLADHLAIMADHLMSHQGREETVLFPMMLTGGHPMIRHPISRMEEEHRDVDEQLLRLSVLTTDFTAPVDACGTWRSLYRTCHEIARDLHEVVELVRVTR